MGVAPDRGAEQTRGRASRRLFWIALTTGMGFMGALDAIAFHHILRWHNLYVHAGEAWRAISDGLLHIVTTGLLLGGVLGLWNSRRLLSQVGPDRASLASGIWVGMGVFQLLDGVLSHKLLRLHPVREGAANILPYDFAWISFAILLIVIGWLVGRRTSTLNRDGLE